MQRIAGIESPGSVLLELVVVITILVLLAAFAVPRVSSLEAETHVAATEFLAGSIRSSAAVSHALWLSQGQPAALAMRGATIVMVNGYPDRATIDDALGTFDGFSYDVGSGAFRRDGAGAGCAVSYAEAPRAGSGPLVAVETSGC